MTYNDYVEEVIREQIDAERDSFKEMFIRDLPADLLADWIIETHKEEFMSDHSNEFNDMLDSR